MCTRCPHVHYLQAVDELQEERLLRQHFPSLTQSEIAGIFREDCPVSVVGKVGAIVRYSDFLFRLFGHLDNQFPMVDMDLFLKRREPRGALGWSMMGVKHNEYAMGQAEGLHILWLLGEHDNVIGKLAAPCFPRQLG